MKKSYDLGGDQTKVGYNHLWLREVHTIQCNNLIRKNFDEFDVMHAIHQNFPCQSSCDQLIRILLVQDIRQYSHRNVAQLFGDPSLHQCHHGPIKNKQNMYCLLQQHSNCQMMDVSFAKILCRYTLFACQHTDELKVKF